MLQHDYMLIEMYRSNPAGKGEIRCCRREREHCQRDVLSRWGGGSTPEGVTLRHGVLSPSTVIGAKTD